MRYPSRKFWITLACAAALLLGLRLALPHWLERQLNAQMAHMGDYAGHIEDVDLYLWAGAYAIDGVQITKRTEEIPVPFLDLPRMDLSVSWKALLHGKFVADSTWHSPVVNIVDDRDGLAQIGEGVDWRQRLEELGPIRIDEIRIRDGTVHFRNYSTDPVVDLQLRAVEGSVRNLTNVREEGGRTAEYALTGELFGAAPVELEGVADPFNATEDFQLRMKIDTFDLTNLNEFLQAYANLDVNSGSGTYVMELEARDGRLDGYAKPLFTDVEVFSWKQDVERQGDNPLRVLWEAIAGTIENVFKNQAQDQFATRIEIHGNIDNPDTSALEAIAGVLKNAFVEAYRPRFENLPPSEDAGAAE